MDTHIIIFILGDTGLIISLNLFYRYRKHISHVIIGKEIMTGNNQK